MPSTPLVVRWKTLVATAIALALGVPALAAAQPSMSSTVLPAAGLDPGDAFGRRVAISGSTMVVGANGDDEKGEYSGAAYVFERSAAGEWTPAGKLVGSLQREFDFAGWSVAIDGDTIVVGAPGDDRDAQGVPGAAASNRGAAYVFRRAPGGWVEEARLQPPELHEGCEFGGRVAIDGDTALVAALYFDEPDAFFGSIPKAGGVWVYRRTTAGWTFEGLLTAALRLYEGRFGFALDIEGDTAVVGAPGGNVVREFRRTGSAWAHAGLVTPAQGVPVDASGLGARFSNPLAIAADADGSAWVLDEHLGNLVIRRIAPGGAVATVFTTTGSVGFAGDGLARSQAGDVFFATTPGPGTSSIRKLTAGGVETVLTTLATEVRALDADEAGGVFVADGTTVSHVAANGTVTLVAGAPGESAIVDGAGTTARFKALGALSRTATGDLVVADDRRVIRRVTPGTGAVVTVAGADEPLASQADGPGASARFSFVRSLAASATGDVYIADQLSIRRLSASLEVSTVAGRFGPFADTTSPVDGTGAAADVLADAIVAAPGDGAMFVDRRTVRAMGTGGNVRTLAGIAPDSRFGVPYSRSPLYGYSIDLREQWLVVGAPTATPPNTAAVGAGLAWVFDRTTTGAWNQGIPVAVTAPEPTVRYGEAVAITPAGDIVLGAANGCTWVAPGTCENASAGTPAETVVSPPVLFRQGALGSWTERLRLSRPDAVIKGGYGNALASAGGLVAVAEPEYTTGRVFVFDLATLDLDGDGLPDEWETQFGLDPESTVGDDGADGDPDGDGRTNAQELAARSHPRNLASATRYFAEGATSAFFETRLAIANPGPEPATVALRFTAIDRSLRSTWLTVPPGQSRKLPLSQVPGLATAEFSTVLETDRPVVAERQMWWSAAVAYGAHRERAVTEPALVWYLAEGATHSGFDLFYLLQNANAGEARVRVRYLRPAGPPLEKTYVLPPNSRTNIWVDLEEFGGQPLLADTDVSAVVEVLDAKPIIVERAMYLTRTSPQGDLFEAGHESAGVTAPAVEWLLAEGATGDFFDLFVLVANPGRADAEIEATFLLPDGTAIVKPYTVAADSRFNIWVDLEDPRLADTAVSTTIRSTNGVPVIVERAMWWPGPTPATWTEAHNSPGSTESGTIWGVADGVVSVAPGLDTYVLVANVGPSAARVRVTLLYDDGGTAESREFDVTPRSRFNVDVRSAFPAALGRGFGALVESLGDTPAPIVVESAIYSDAGGRRWAAGSNALATKLQ